MGVILHFHYTNSEVATRVITQNEIKFQTYPTPSSSLIGNGENLNDNQWHHIVATYSSSDGEMTLTIDEGLTNSSSATGSIRSYNQVRIGAITHTDIPSSAIDAIIDDIRIYNRALTEHEITELYNEAQ